MPFVALADIRSFVHAFVPMRATYVCVDKELPDALRKPIEQALKLHTRIERIDSRPMANTQYDFIVCDGDTERKGLHIRSFTTHLKTQGVASVICGSIDDIHYHELPWLSSLPVKSYWKH